MWKTLQDEGKNHGHQSAKNFIISEVFTKRRSMATSYKMIYLYGDKSRLICRGGGGHLPLTLGILELLAMGLRFTLPTCLKLHWPGRGEWRDMYIDRGEGARW
jgi:hypothetical protein